MAEAEYAGLAQMFGGLSEGLGQYQAGREAKRQAYRDCVFMGGDPQECAYKTGYTPKGEELGEAAGVHGRRQAQARQTMMEETAAEHRPVPVQDMASFGLPVRERLRQATIRPGEPTTVPVKKDLAGEIYRHKEKLAGEERKRVETLETEKRRLKTKIGEEERAKGRSKELARFRLELSKDLADYQAKLKAKPDEADTELDKLATKYAEKIRTSAKESFQTLEEALGEFLPYLPKSAWQLISEKLGILDADFMATATPEGGTSWQPIRPPTQPGVRETAEPSSAIPPELQTELAGFGSFDEWYNSLSPEDQADLTPEEEELIRAYYGTVR